MTCLGVLERGDRDKGNATGWKEGGGIERSTTVPYMRCSLSFAFELYLPSIRIPNSRSENDFTAASPGREVKPHALCTVVRVAFH